MAAMRRIGCLLAREEALPLEEAKQRALLEVALAHSPRVESAGVGLAYLDVAGLRGLFGEEREIGERLCGAAAGRGLSVRVGIAGSRASALLAARWGDGVAVVPPGDEAAYLAPAPCSLLDLSAEMARLLDRWGIRTLGELSRLPAPALFERLGADGPRLQALARGEDPRPLRPWAPPRMFEERVEGEWAMDTLDPLIALLADLAGRVCARLERERLSADAFEWSCRLDDGTSHDGRFVPAVPTTDTGIIVHLLRAALEARPPQGAVVGVALRAYPVRAPSVQETLAASSRPSPRALTETLARLAALVGPERVGIPVLLDSHCPDAMRLAPFRLASSLPPREGRGAGEPSPLGGEGRVRGPVLALCRLRPPHPAKVTLIAGRPVHLRSDLLAGSIVASAGPWRASGEWWLERPFFQDEWDVELEGGTLCRLSHDGSTWFLAGIYD
ncbi:MAG: DNA polymerase Y family protein [Candidatus Rokubacteria bacterium]|nr:DNA polymerase Y family protein [Candidatus Rokubacteria bacterium]